MAATKVIKAASSLSLSDTAKNALVFTGIGVSLWLGYKIVSTVSNVVDTVTSPVKNVNEAIKQQQEAAAKLKKEISDFEKTNDYKLAFTPDMWQGKTSDIVFISNENALKFAKDINSAFGTINDDEEKIYGVYRQIPSKASAMKVAVYYFSYFKADLYQTLKNKLSDAELKVIIDIVKSKKDFTKKS